MSHHVSYFEGVLGLIALMKMSSQKSSSNGLFGHDVHGSSENRRDINIGRRSSSGWTIRVNEDATKLHPQRRLVLHEIGTIPLVNTNSRVRSQVDGVGMYVASFDNRT